VAFSSIFEDKKNCLFDQAAGFGECGFHLVGEDFS
jgi:hypothetical protein